jgi:hypothetical protein
MVHRGGSGISIPSKMHPLTRPPLGMEPLPMAAHYNGGRVNRFHAITGSIPCVQRTCAKRCPYQKTVGIRLHINKLINVGNFQLFKGGAQWIIVRDSNFVGDRANNLFLPFPLSPYLLYVSTLPVGTTPSGWCGGVSSNPAWATTARHKKCPATSSHQKWYHSAR